MASGWKFSETPYSSSGGGGSSSSSGGWNFSDTSFAAKKPKKGGGGGLFGWLGKAAHWTGGKLDLAAHDIAGMPGGAYKLAKDTVIVATHPSYSQPHHKSPLLSDVKGLALGAEQSVKHPLRDPFQTLLTLAPAVGTAGRLGEAGVAAKAAEGGALEKLGAAGKALTEHGGQPVRTIHVGGKPVTLIGSRNPTVRLLQRGYDRMIQRALDREATGEFAPGRVRGRATARLAKHGQARAGGALHEEQMIAQRMNAVPADLLDHAAGRLSRIPGKAGNRLQQAALELTSTQVPAEEAAAYHFAQAAKGVNPKVNTLAARLYQQVADRGLVHVDETRGPGQKVFINPKFGKLAKADARLAAAQERGDTLLAEHNIMSRQELAQRVNAPGRITAGAHYENPTPGKLGIVSPKLAEARAIRDRLASLHEKALQADERWLAKQKTRDLRGPMTEEQARARLAQLDKTHQELINGKIRKAKGGKWASSKPLPTVREEEAALAEAKMAELAAKHAGKGKAWADALQQHLDERAQLQDLLNRRADAAIFGHEPPALPRQGEQPKLGLEPNPHRDRIVTTGHALEQAQGRVNRLEAAAAKRVKPTGIVGGESARPGRGYVGEGYSEKRLARSEHARSQGPVHGKAREPISKQPYTGRNKELGLRPRDVTGGASRHLRMVQRYENTDRLRRSALETGSAIRRSNRDVLLAVPDATQGDIPSMLRQAFGQEKLAVDHPVELAAHLEDAARAEGLRAALRMRVGKWLDRVETSRNDAIGTEAPKGYRWVDEHMIQQLQDESRPRGGAGAALGHAVDDVNSAVTALTVYFKVGHIGTRVLTNAATNLIQGSLNPLSLARSYRLWRSLSEEEQARMLAASGQHGFAALPAESADIIGRGARRGAQWWARHADAMFRFNSLAYEFRKAGIRTVDQTKAALDALQTSGKGLPAHEWSKISAAARRADREAISYDRLNSFEKRYLTRGIWFYPWVKGSTLFTVRSMLEHPWKMGVAANLGAQGRREQLSALGEVPSYEQGLIALGGGASPMTTDFSTFSPFATAGEVAQVPRMPQDIAGFFNPALGAGTQFAYGLNRYGAPSKTPYLDALLSLGSPTPEQQIAEAIAARGQDQSGRMFQKTPGSTLLRFLIGPAMPRRVNPSALAKAAAREKSGQR